MRPAQGLSARESSRSEALRAALHHRTLWTEHYGTWAQLRDHGLGSFPRTPSDLLFPQALQEIHGCVLFLLTLKKWEGRLGHQGLMNFWIKPPPRVTSQRDVGSLPQGTRHPPPCLGGESVTPQPPNPGSRPSKGGSVDPGCLLEGRNYGKVHACPWFSGEAPE